ncbi:hypothetical protein F5B17DRAFT_119546 [Nemania serpens]|nr:hypothetical protein F5B17DRAFT_119546 [Nemania serpens]
MRDHAQNQNTGRAIQNQSWGAKDRPHLSTETAIRVAANHLVRIASNVKQIPLETTPSLYFHQHIVATLQTDGTFSSSSSRLAAPTFACLDLRAVGSCRDKSSKMPRCNRRNPPVDTVRQKWQRRLRPSSEVEDPYIATVLIALAQQRRH